MSDDWYDFKFGWRWLLPIQGCRTVALLGFDDDEVKFWQQAMPMCRFSNEPRAADAYIIDADRVDDGTGGTSRVLKEAGMLCLVGRRRPVRKWQALLSGRANRLREYGLLPASNPRVVIPLQSSRDTSYALALHRPGRGVARLGVKLAGILARLGNTALLRGRSLIIATADPDAVPYGAVHAEIEARLKDSPGDYALYLGVMGPNRKTVALPLGEGEPRAIIKSATSPRARESLTNEAAVLECLKGTAVERYVPRLLGSADNHSGFSLLQEYRSRRPAGTRELETAVIDFLGLLSSINRRSRPLSTLLEALACEGIGPGTVRGPAELEDIWARLQALAGTGMLVWEHRAHGDFAPWNCFFTDQGFFVFDWEEGRECDLAFSDMFYFIVAPQLYLKRAPDAQKTLDGIGRMADRVAEKAGFGEIDIWVYLACWLLRRLETDPFYPEMLRALVPRWQ